MKIRFTFFIFFLAGLGCQKNSNAPEKDDNSLTECDAQMIQKAKEAGYKEFNLPAGQYDYHGVHLTKVNYDGQIMYYYHPACNPALCSIGPLSSFYGVSCKDDTTWFTNSAKFKFIETIFTGKKGD